MLNDPTETELTSAESISSTAIGAWKAPTGLPDCTFRAVCG